MDCPLQPYRGKPKVSLFEYENTDIFSQVDVSVRPRQLDVIWMIHHALGTYVMPMWVGFNAEIQKYDLPQQMIMYMPNLKQPITSFSVINNTLVTIQKCSEECKQQYGVVT